MASVRIGRLKCTKIQLESGLQIHHGYLTQGFVLHLINSALALFDWPDSS